MALIISEQVTKKLIDMPRALALAESVLRDYAAGKVRRLPRGRLRGKQKGLNIMAGWHSDWDLFCMRFYSGKRTSSISLHSGRTGELLALINASYLAPLRTGATSGVAAKYLASEGARVLGVIGPGRQAGFQVAALVLSTSVQTVLVYGRNQARKKQFIGAMRKTIASDIRDAASIDQVESQSDIILLATDSKAPILDGRLLKDEVLVISIGANQIVKHEVSNNLIGRMDLVVTDDRATAELDAGDLIRAREAGILRWETIVPLDAVVAGKAFQERPKKILFQSNGIADDALAVGRYVFNAARRKRIRVTRVKEI